MATWVNSHSIIPHFLSHFDFYMSAKFDDLHSASVFCVFPFPPYLDNKVMACCCGSCWQEKFHFGESTVSQWLMGWRWTNWLCPFPRPVRSPLHVLWRVRGTHLENRNDRLVIAEVSPVFLSCRATGITTSQASVNVPETYFWTFIIKKGNASNYPLQQEKLLKYGSVASDKQTD